MTDLALRRALLLEALRCARYYWPDAPAPPDMSEAAARWAAGEDFREDDARNFAGWIVGQWLASGYPLVSTFADQWRERFAA